MTRSHRLLCLILCFGLHALACDFLQSEDPSRPPRAEGREKGGKGAKWIWTKDLALDNTVLFRIRVGSPPDGRPLPPKWPRGHID
jgi:hypothetical protein